MNEFTRRAWTVPWLVAAALLVTGCQSFRLPAIDPTGERIFSSTEPLRLAAPGQTRCAGPNCLFPRPAWNQGITPPPCPEPPPPPPPGAKSCGAAQATIQPRPVQRGIPGKIMVNPTRLIAPVGSEVVLVGGLCGDDGYLITCQKIEWSLSQDSVGQFVDFNDRGGYWYASKKLSSDYAITHTSHRSEVVTRGTPSVTDDIVQQKGQCWITLTSASEGTSYVTALAPEGATWPQRRQVATILWIDCQWAFPNPAAVPAGQPHTLSTHLTRTATNAPIAGWIIRYEVIDGTSATFGPDNSPVIEVRTDENGLGNALLQPADSGPGVTQVHIEVIRPADPNSDAPRTKLGEGFTSVTWSAPGLALHASGPQTAAVDATLVYRVEVSNPGDVPAREVVVEDVLPPNLEFISSSPQAQSLGNRCQWRLGDLPPKAVQVIEINARAVAGGAIRYAFHATSTDGLQADAAADTEIAQPSLRLNVTGPTTATVGERVQFRIDVTNSGDVALDNVMITDRFDASLEHAEGETSPIEKLIGRLDPGRTEQFAVGFIVRRAGQICHVLEVSAPGGQYAQQQACLTATDAAVAAQPQMTVTKSGPQEAGAGKNVQFTTRVTNTGNVPLTNIRVVDTYGPELAPQESTEGVDLPELAASGRLVWTIASLPPGGTARRDVLCTCTQPTEKAWSRVTVTADGGVTQTAEAAIRILASAAAAPAGPPQGRPPTPTGQLAVEISELGDPIRIGEATNYEIQIRNARSVSDRNVVLKIEFPPGLRFERLVGPVARRNVSADGSTVVVSPILEVRAGETVAPSFNVGAKGVQVGEHKVRVTVTSELSPQGVVAEEFTSVTAE